MKILNNFFKKHNNNEICDIQDGKSTSNTKEKILPIKKEFVKVESFI